MNDGYYVFINNDLELTWYPISVPTATLELNNLYYLSFDTGFVDLYDTNHKHIGYSFSLGINKCFVTEAEFKANLRDKRIDEILGDD